MHDNLGVRFGLNVSKSVLDQRAQPIEHREGQLHKCLDHLIGFIPFEQRHGIAKLQVNIGRRNRDWNFRSDVPEEDGILQVIT